MKSLYSTMLSLSALSALVSVAAGSTAYRGFAMNDHRADNNACKTYKDWESDFALMAQAVGSQYTSIRVYISSECDTLNQAAIAARQVPGRTILAGIYQINDEQDYHTDMSSFVATITTMANAQDDFSWLAGVSIGNEDIYNQKQTAPNVVTAVDNLRSQLSALANPNAKSIKIGHVDTYRQFDASSTDDIAMVNSLDFIGMNNFPYWDNDYPDNSFPQAFGIFKDSIADVQKTIAASTRDPKPELWVTETGWPVSGDSHRTANADEPDTQNYWNQVNCWLVNENPNIPFWWYTLQDFGIHGTNPSFGVLGQDGTGVEGMAFAC